VYRHALRSALTPVVTQFGIDLGQLVGGVVVTETVFSLPGLGKTAIDAINTQDLPVIIGIVIFASAAVVVANILVDIMYAVPTAQPLSIGSDTKQVLRDVTRTRSWSTRLEVMLWPGSGREQLRIWARAAAELLARPGQELGDRVDSWTTRRRRRSARTRPQ
jgi:hypothetical protein